MYNLILGHDISLLVTDRCVTEEFSLTQWLWNWIFHLEVPNSNPAGTLYFCHAFVYFFVTDFVCKMGACPELAIEPLIPFNVKNKMCLGNTNAPKRPFFQKCNLDIDLDLNDMTLTSWYCQKLPAYRI